MEEQNEEPVVTMEEIFQEQALLEEEAASKELENWGDEKVCTYEKGHIKQPVYACLTCSHASGKQFGFCFGCSMNCHLNHEVLELFDKRHFKCDCGTPISGCQCILSLESDRSSVNSENKYTHNFNGKYCFCNKGYNPYEDEMIQCFICEDWFHEICIKSRTKVIPDRSIAYNDFFVCKECYNRVSFLSCYSQCRIKLQGGPANNPLPTASSEAEPLASTETKPLASTEAATPASTEAAPPAPIDVIPANSVTAPVIASNQSLAPALECKCDTSLTVVETEDTFWIPNWRKQLCVCSKCKQLYISLGVAFLVEEFDETEDANSSTAADTDAPSTAQPASSGSKRPFKLLLEESAEQAFLKNNNIDNENKLNVIYGYNEMSEKLRAYLDTFAKTGRVVTKEDIDNFFNGLQDAKRQKK